MSYKNREPERGMGRGLLPLLICALLLIAEAAAAGPWTTGKGKLWGKVGYAHWLADRRFVSAGTQNQRPNGTLPSPGVRARLASDVEGAELTHQAWALSASFGVLENLDVTVYLPIVRAAFADATRTQAFDTVGLGDPIVGAKYQWLEHLGFSFDVKIPVSRVPRVSTDLPISEGQFDLTIWERAGAGFGGEAWSGWAELDIGYRLRFPFAERLPPAEGGVREFTPGNEFVLRAGAGFRPWLDWLAVMLKVEMLLGGPGEDHAATNNLVLPLPNREVIELQPGLLFEPGWDVGVEFAVGLPVYGRNYPAGWRVFVGLFRRFSLWGE